jgi:hypothetical protein
VCIGSVAALPSASLRGLRPADIGNMFNLCPLLAFGFGNLAMLGWLAAAAAPLLIHLWSRRKYRETPWAAVTFLLAAMRRSSRRIQLQQWLLLAVRTAIIALVVLAIAEPYGTGSLAVGPTGIPAHKVLVLDGSYSMAYRDGDASLFDRAKQLAAQVVRDGGSADKFTVILMAQPARIVVGREIVDQAAVAAQIETLVQTHAGADLAGACALVVEALASDESRPGGAGRSEVYFFTDLQRETWSDAASGRLAELPASSVVLVDLAPAAAANLAVTRLAQAEPLATAGQVAAYDVVLRMFGAQPRKSLLVELLMDGVPVAEQTLEIPADGEVVARFTHRFRAPGSHVVAVRAASDSLDIDNTRRLVVLVRDEVRVLCVAGKPGAARYVANALDPDETDDSPVRPIVASEGDVAELDLEQFDAVFLCNLAQLTAGEARRLARFAEAGGGVVVFLGDQARPGAYNAPEAAALLPARLGRLVVERQFAVDPLDYQHPIVAPFRGREAAGLLTTPVARHFRLELPDDLRSGGVEIAAALANGDPFIVTRRLGSGRVILVATDGSLASVDPESGEPWTDWPAWPSFLPLIREMLLFAAGGGQPRQQLVGTPLRGDAIEPPGQTRLQPSAGEAASPPSTVRIERPDGRTDVVAVENGGARGWWSYSGTELSGVYVARRGDGLPPQPFAVNVETSESDLTRIDPSLLPPDIQVRSIPQADSAAGAGRLMSRAGWQAPLLASAFGLLLLESLLAWLFGRGVA